MKRCVICGGDVNEKNKGHQFRDGTYCPNDDYWGVTLNALNDPWDIRPIIGAEKIWKYMHRYESDKCGCSGNGCCGKCLPKKGISLSKLVSTIGSQIFTKILKQAGRNKMSISLKKPPLPEQTRAHTYVSCRICKVSGSLSHGKFRTEFDEPEICEHRAKFEGLMPDDVIERRGEYSHYRFTFPTLCVDGTGCGGYHSMYFGSWYDNGKRVPRIFNGRKFPIDLKDGELTWMIALIQWSDAYHGFDNNAPIPKFCKCDDRIKVLDEKMKQLENTIISIGKWKMLSTSIPNRGICDYSREIVTRGPLLSVDFEILNEWVSIKDNPGYCGRGSSMKYGPNGIAIYTFTSTMDSSD